MTAAVIGLARLRRQREQLAARRGDDGLVDELDLALAVESALDLLGEFFDLPVPFALTDAGMAAIS